MAFRDFDGIHFMLPTPFLNDGSIDRTSLQRCVAHARTSGCVGVVALGVMGEAHRLLEAERQQVIATVVDASNDDLKVSVGISSQSAQQATARLLDAQDRGANAVMASPPSLAKPNDNAVANYYAALNAATSIPLIVQDLPEQTGVHMSPQLIGAISRDLEHAKMLKLEDPPTPPKVSSTIDATDGRMAVFGGLGGSFLFEELRRGAAGAMTGFAFSEVLVAIHRNYAAGDPESARRLFYDWLPLIRYENSAGLGLSIRKEILRRRGLLDTANVRPPTPAIDDAGREELDDLMQGMATTIAQYQ